MNFEQIFKHGGSAAGIVALCWNIGIHFLSRRGRLEVSLGWGTDEIDFTTYLYLDVVNKGTDTRVIDNVSIVYLDRKQKRNTRSSTNIFIKNLPGKILKRGEKQREIIRYRDNSQLTEIFFNHKILFRVEDTFGKKYDSTMLNDGVFSLPDRVISNKYLPN